MDEEATAHAAATQRLVRQMNDHLAAINSKLDLLAEVEKSNLRVAALAQDMAYLGIRAMAELHVDFRTMLIRLAQEPTPNPFAAEGRAALLESLADQQRSSGERPQLKPVPPTDK